GVDRDQADRALGLERAQFFLHARARQPEPTSALGDFDRHQVAVVGVGTGARGDRELLAGLLLVDRNEPPAAARQPPIDAEHALLAAVDQLDDAPAVADRIAPVGRLLDPQQDAVADAGRLAGTRAARDVHVDLRRRAVAGLVPFGRQRDQLAVGVA